MSPPTPPCPHRRTAVRTRRAGHRFHARRRGPRALRHGRPLPRRRRRRRDRHLLRQVDGAARRRGAADRRRLYTDRPPPRFRRAPAGLGVPRHVDGRPGHRPVRHPADVAPHARRRRARRPRRRGRRASRRRWRAVWRTPLQLLFIDGGHTEEAAQRDFDGWAQVGRRRRRAGHPRRVPEPRRRRSGALPRLPPGTRHRRVHARSSATGSMRVLERVRPRRSTSAAAGGAVAVVLAFQAARQVGAAEDAAAARWSTTGRRRPGSSRAPVQVVRSTGHRLPSANTRPVQ